MRADLVLGKLVNLACECLEHRVMALADLDGLSVRIPPEGHGDDVMTMNGAGALAAQELSDLAAFPLEAAPATGVVRDGGHRHSRH